MQFNLYRVSIEFLTIFGIACGAILIKLESKRKGKKHEPKNS